MQREINQDPDYIGQSGWVFADLLLALSVIFLATISFVPSSQNEATSVEPQSSNLRSTFDSARFDFIGSFSKVYDSEKLASIGRDIDEYMKSNRFSDEVFVLNLQVIGANQFKDSESGIVSALRASIEIQDSIPEVTRFAKVDLSTSSDLKESQVLVIALFGKVQP